MEVPGPFTSLVDTAAALRAGVVSSREVVQATLDRIARLDPTLRSYVTVAGDGALAEAEARDRERRQGRPPGPLHGVPVAIKDTLETRGLRTTYGSTLFADHVPAEDELSVERLRAAGAVIIGKTNTPEFAISSHTWNPIAGLCRNPHALDRTPGGSSGGSAAALAAGLCAGAVGSDFGGSLRGPASFCGVVAFRTSPGRVPQHPKLAAWDTLNVNGPMARSVRDVAALLAVMAGPDARDPTSIDEPGAALALADGSPPPRGLRVAWSPDLGAYPVQRTVREACGRAVTRLADLGWVVEEAYPDVAAAAEAWPPLRAALMLHTHAERVRQHRDRLSPPIVWNVEQFLGLSALDVGRAEQARTRLYGRVGEFLTRYDLLITPAAAVEPWPVEVRHPTEIDGRSVANYYAWAGLTFTFSLTGLPVLSLPCGRLPSGLPLNVQVIGPFHGERRVLLAARSLEALWQVDARPPAPYGV